MKLTEAEKEKIEEEFRRFVSIESSKMTAKNGESEGEELSESDESNITMSGATEFSSPSEPFGTFQL